MGIAAILDQTVWCDELLSLADLHFSFKDLWAGLRFLEDNPPFYFYYLKLFVLLFEHITPLGAIAAARLASIVPIILLVVVSFTKVRKNWGALCGAVFAFCMTVMPQMMHYGIEIRGYTMVCFFMTMTFLYAYDCAKNPSAKHFLLLTLFALLSAYTQYFGIITAVCVYAILAIWFLRQKKYKPLLSWFLSGLSIALLLLPWFVTQFSKSTLVMAKEGALHFTIVHLDPVVSLARIATYLSVPIKYLNAYLHNSILDNLFMIFLEIIFTLVVAAFVFPFMRTKLFKLLAAGSFSLFAIPCTAVWIYTASPHKESFVRTVLQFSYSKNTLAFSVVFVFFIIVCAFITISMVKPTKKTKLRFAKKAIAVRPKVYAKKTVAIRPKAVGNNKPLQIEQHFVFSGFAITAFVGVFAIFCELTIPYYQYRYAFPALGCFWLAFSIAGSRLMELKLDHWLTQINSIQQTRRKTVIDQRILKANMTRIKSLVVGLSVFIFCFGSADFLVYNIRQHNIYQASPSPYQLISADDTVITDRWVSAYCFSYLSPTTKRLYFTESMGTDKQNNGSGVVFNAEFTPNYDFIAKLMKESKNLKLVLSSATVPQEIKSAAQAHHYEIKLLGYFFEEAPDSEQWGVSYDKNIEPIVLFSCQKAPFAT
jgi:4-amino-4-deoxy-L-arabinose transferase-like glycosyltransferase